MTAPTRTTCRICGNDKLVPFCKLADTPLADRFITEGQAEDSYPLEVMVCSECYLVQQVCEVPDSELYGSDYGFFSSSSPSSIRYFQEYAKQVIEKYPEQSKDFVVEIASNDGLLLQQFKDGEVLGVDPAEPAARKARHEGIPTMIAPFSTQVAKLIEKDLGKATLIIANNVIAHVIDTNDLIEGVANLLDKKGVFVAEFQYLPQLLFNNEFDHIYHEHRCFFSFYVFSELLKRHNLVPVDVVRTEAQGGSLRVYCKHKEATQKANQSVDDLVKYEKDLGIDNIETYKGFQVRVEYIKGELLRILKDLKSQGKKIYGYGASAKGCTLLNHCEIGSDLLDGILDVTPYKIGKLSPGMNLKIVDKCEADYYLLLVWNYLPGILKREKEFIDRGGKFIVPIATPYII